MSMKSGNDSTKKTEEPAASQEPLSSGSSLKNTGRSDPKSMVPLGPRVGDLNSIKSQLTEELANVVKEENGKELSQDGKLVLAQFLDNTSRGYAATLGMICQGPNCPFLSGCKLNDLGSKLPIGKKCPIEASILTLWINKHLKALGIEDPDDPINSFDMDMLYELAGQELIRWRCGVHLSKSPSLMTTQVAGFSNQGEPIFIEVMNPVLEIMERSGKNVSKIREALVATREAQLKAGSVKADPSTRQADLRKKAMEIIGTRRQPEPVKEAEFKVKE